MVEIELDGCKVEAAEGSMIMHAAEKAGTYIPHFCYHKKLSIAANCRMCLVDVEKMPKPVPACATPVAQGMVIRTKSEKAIQAQQSVMEFLLINHPLDCPVCDQGGECQLQDLAVGYGGSGSRYQEEKRVVPAKDVGPLISMEEMSRCIQCTRCVRFGQEIAGQMELGMVNRGEHSEIETFVHATVDSELSGNMIDICPVGALTSKPFRFAARTWELGRRRSISPHDSTGANLILQVKNNRVLRVVPFENEAVNECWIADRDRFSYEALNSSDRLTSPMIKQGGEWREVDWQTALEYVANGLGQIKLEHGADSIGALVSPHSTLEELALMTKLVRGLGSDNVDYRLRHLDFRTTGARDQARWLGTSIASLSTLQRVLVVGSNLRKDHPLFAQRIRQAARHGAEVCAVVDQRTDWAMPLRHVVEQSASQWVTVLAQIAAAVAAAKGISAPATVEPTENARAVAASLLSDVDGKAVLLGNAAAHHPQAQDILALANWIAEHTQASCGYLTEAANTVGAQLVGAYPKEQGKTAAQMVQPDALAAVLLLNVEPEHDHAAGLLAAQGLSKAQMVVTFSPFKTNMHISDVLLPISPFSETSGTFVNAEARVQSFYAATKPLGDTRPAWKVLRVLGNMLNLKGFEQESTQQVLQELALHTHTIHHMLNNSAGVFEPSALNIPPPQQPVTASIYQLDALVRRSPSLQATADGRVGRDIAHQIQGGHHG